MDSAQLLKRVIEHGADEAGIYDRFDGNAELYEMCFMDFIEEPNFDALSKALNANDYKRAFEAAHALKGLSGNLGVSGFYDAICVLVESLRLGKGDNVQAQYADVMKQYTKLKGVLTGENQTDANDAQERQNETAETKDVTAQEPVKKTTKGASVDAAKKKRDMTMRVSVILILVALFFVGLMFVKIGLDYRENIISESGKHLIEMSNQIKLYIEEQVATDWRIAKSVSDSITGGDYTNDSEGVLGILDRRRSVWDVSDLMIYMENGYCMYSNGDTVANDVASDTIVNARELGRYMTVIDSKIIYTIPIKTEVTLNGSRIVATSVVQDMKTFLDDMNFSSFGDQALMYLTEENGTVISMLSNKQAMTVFNFKVILDGRNIASLDEGVADEEIYSTGAPAAFLVTNGKTSNYVVSAPISTDALPLRLYFIAPEAVVNGTMNGFSRQLTVFSVMMIVLFGALAVLVFMLMYRNRKRLFDKAIMDRERMFDLLIKNTRIFFTLFDVSKEEPVFISSNINSVIGDKYWALDRSEKGYILRNDTATDTEVIHSINESLSGWDGKTVYKSGYIRGEQATATPFYFEFQLYPIDTDGKGYVGIAQDMTQAYEREEATKAAMEMATRSNEAKSRFLSNMSHDIRTPMNAIMNMTSFALENVDSPKKLGVYLRTIRESSEHLLHLINDVLDMSRIESGQTVVASEPFDLIAIIQKQAEMVRPLCAAKSLTLITDFSGINTSTVKGDALKLSQIMMNLLSNAVKFTQEKGHIRFTATELPSLRDDMVDVRFSVEDNGMGISADYIESIFEPFSRGSESRISEIEGTGLGLSICRSYVEALGGTIYCESEEREGSTFVVELFFEKVGELRDVTDHSARIGDANFLGLHCLVAEDNTTNQMIAKTLLERLGFIVDFANDGRDCVLKFLTSKPGTFDIVYMDIHMPVTDGYQATSEIRMSGHPQAETIPIIAMSANVFAEDIEKARVVGMDAYIGKPIMTLDLIEQTNRALDKKREMQT